jgi:hypothetical protein
MSGKFRVNEVAGILKVSQTTIYKRFAGMKDRLKPHVQKVRGVLIFDEAALEILRESIVTADKDSVQLSASTDIGNPVQEGIAELKKVLLTMADTMRNMAEENRTLQAEVAGLKHQVANLQVALLPPSPQLEVPCVPWSPAPRSDPAAGMTWWYRLWVEITEPEKLRFAGN